MFISKFWCSFRNSWCILHMVGMLHMILHMVVILHIQFLWGREPDTGRELLLILLLILIFLLVWTQFLERNLEFGKMLKKTEFFSWLFLLRIVLECLGCTSVRNLIHVVFCTCAFYISNICLSSRIRFFPFSTF